MADIVVYQDAALLESKHLTPLGRPPEQSRLKTAHRQCFELFRKRSQTMPLAVVRVFRNAGEAVCHLHDGKQVIQTYLAGFDRKKALT